MNQEDLLNVIGEAAEEMLERSEKKTVPVKKIVFAAVAACLALVITISLVAPPADRYHIVSKHRVTRALKEPSQNKPIEMGVCASGDTENYAYRAFSAEVKIRKVFSDQYIYMLNERVRWYVLELQVLDQIGGENIPEIIYCWVPAQYYNPDITKYDSLIIGMTQSGMEGFALLNADTRRVEYFGTMFNFQGYIAFNNGKVEMSMNKLQLTDKVLGCCQCNNPDHIYVAHLGRSLEETKQAIRKAQEIVAEKGKTAKAATPAVLSGEAKEVYDYVSDVNNGVFFQQTGNANEFLYTRYINGYYTDEIYLINAATGEVRGPDKDGGRYTAEDIKAAPELEEAMKNIDTSKLTVPTEPELDVSRRREFKCFEGSYRKVDGKVYGVVKVHWKDVNIKKGTIGNSFVGSYIVIKPDGSTVEVVGKLDISAIE